jgi:hypothetical protein
MLLSSLRCSQGLGCAFPFVAPPSNERRIPKSVQRAVIARDLTSKGLKWDPAKYHIDHVVPFFSRREPLNPQSPGH